jgi:phage terminase small subunit
MENAKVTQLKPKKKAIKPPKHLSLAMKRWWMSVNESFVLEDHHRLLLTKAAEAHDRAEEARAAIKKHGTIYLDRFEQPCARPEIAIERDSRLAFARLIRELNLSEAPDDPLRPNSLRFGGRK